MRTLLVMLVGFSAVTMAETVPEDVNPEISVLETPGAPIVIGNLVQSAVETKGAPTTALTLTVRSTAEPADSFTVRVEIIGGDGEARGFYTHARLLEDVEVRFTVLLTNWSLQKGDRLHVAVIKAHVGNRTWSEGVWTDDPEMELPQGAGCARDFCLAMSAACNVTCKRAGCVLRFKCSMGPKSCDSDCICRQNVICGGP